MYDLGLFFWYRPIFMTELLVAECLFLFRLKKRKGFLWRFPLSLLICYGVSFAVPYFDNAYYQCLVFFAFFATSCLVSLLCFEAPFNSLLFAGIAGYNLQHCSYELYNFLLIVTGLSTHGTSDFYSSSSGSFFTGPGDALLYGGTYLLLYFGFFFFFASKIKKDEELYIKSAGMFILTVVCLFTDIVINSLVISYRETTTPVILSYIDILSVILCVVVMSLQFELADRRKLDYSLELLSQIREKEKEQYLSSKENVALINMKCHDLKNQIHTIGENRFLPKDTIDDINSVISIYDSTVKTGNETLDVILSEKSLICAKEHIKFTCICDGKWLSFMKEEDAFSFFGNIIDNAIEAVRSLPDDKKVISLSVTKIKSFVSIKVYNYYENKGLRFVDGVPQTTKSDRLNHGFGMQSMNYVCEKYGGDLDCSADCEIFTLKALFPLSPR